MPIIKKANKRITQLATQLKLPGSTWVWEYILASFCLTALAFFAASMLLPRDQQYSQLIVGSIAWRAASKGVDYALPFIALITYPVAYIYLHRLARSIKTKNGLKFELYFRRLLAYSCIPLAIWLGNQIVGKNDDGMLLAFVFLSIGSIGFTSLMMTKKIHFKLSRYYLESVAASLLSVVFSSLSAAAIVLVVNRLPATWNLVSEKVLVFAIVIFVLCFLAFLLATWLKFAGEPDRLLKNLKIILLSSELLLPLLFLILVPSPWQADGENFYGYYFTKQLFVLVITLIVFATYNTFKRFKQTIKFGNSFPLKAAISPLCLIALLLFLKAPQYGVGSVPTDDYHFGEFLLPWWLWREHSYIPFQDYTPARGLINYVPGLLTDVFYDGTASSFSAVFGRAIHILPFLAIGFLSLSKVIGLLPSFVVFLLSPTAGGLFEIYILLTAALCRIGRIFNSRRWVRFLVEWLVICTALLLFAPGQGALFSLGTFPLAATALYKIISVDWRRLKLPILAVTLLALLLSVCTPLDEMIIGAIRYGAEQSSTNSTAYGVEWSISLGKNPVLGPVLWEIVRASWILVGIAVIIMTVHKISKSSRIGLENYLTYAVPIVLLSGLWITRSVGRIDPGSPSRLGEASVWFIFFLLPIFLLTAYRYKAWLVLVLAGVGSILSGVYSSTPVASTVFSPPIQSVNVNPNDFVDGSSIHLSNLGKTLIDQNQLNRLSSIKTVLSSLLKDGETYLDLTNRNAQYFYLGYPPPVEAGAVYNLVHENQQARAIESLERSMPPVVLAAADNMLFDGGKASLRSYRIYRYLVENYTPFEMDSMIWMIRSDRVSELNREELIRALSRNPNADYHILIENSNTQQQAVWEMGNVNRMVNNIGVITNRLAPDPLVDLSLDIADLEDWDIKAVRDFDDNGSLDVLLQHKRENRAEIRLIDDGQSQSIKSLQQLQPGWKIIGIRELERVEQSSRDINISNQKSLELLDLAFRNDDLQYIPSSWGRSFDSLEPKLELVADIPPAVPVGMRNIEKIGAGQYQIQGDDPGIVFDLKPLGLDGRDAGILTLNLACNTNVDSIPMEIYWGSESIGGPNEKNVLRFMAKQGKVVIPLDAYPRWLLAVQIHTLRIDFRDSTSCSEFSIGNIQLFQRRSIDQ